MNADMLVYVVSALGVILVAVLAVAFWRRVSGVQFRWFWVGAGLWTVAVILKLTCGRLTNPSAVGFMKENLPYPLFIVAAGLFGGLQSCAFEMGITWLAARIWRQLGRDAKRAIAIGVGAGAFEAFVLGLPGLAGALIAYAGGEDADEIGQVIKAGAASTSLFWLVAPIERLIALLGHVSTRTLILLGVVKRKPWMVFWGFVIFTLVDGISCAFLVSRDFRARSMWRVELALLPFAIISVPILLSCYRRWQNTSDESPPRELAPVEQ